MKYILLALHCLLVQLSIAQVLNFNTPVNEYRSTVEKYSRFSPFSNNPDSFFVKIFNDDDFVLDTLFPHSDTVNFYMRGYYKNFNPFLIKTDRVEVYILESNVMLNKKKTDRKTLTYMILGIVGSSPENFKLVEEEAKRIYKETGKVVKSTSIQKTKAKGKLYLRHLYSVGSEYPFYSGYGQWYKTGTDYCVYFILNLARLELLKRQEAQR